MCAEAHFELFSFEFFMLIISVRTMPFSCFFSFYYFLNLFDTAE